MQVTGANCCMVCAKMVFALVVTKVFFPGIVLDVNFPTLTASATQKNLISIDLEH
jgi:hypothetical protein